MSRNSIVFGLVFILLLSVFALWNMYPDVNKTSTDIMPLSEDSVIEKWYAPLAPITLGGVTLQASIADTEVEMEQGLSDTPYIPEGVAKLFVFTESQLWGFWMKDMNYPIDIFWLDDKWQVIHIVENASPSSYPEENFVPPTPALYVIETRAGFAFKHNIKVGDKADLTNIQKI